MRLEGKKAAWPVYLGSSEWDAALCSSNLRQFFAFLQSTVACQYSLLCRESSSGLQTTFVLDAHVAFLFSISQKRCSFFFH